MPADSNWNRPAGANASWGNRSGSSGGPLTWGEANIAWAEADESWSEI